MIYCKVLIVFALFSQGLSSGIPIWELLTQQEKVGNLTFLFLDLVNLYCSKSDIPDCEKVLTLYGVSNLLKVDEDTLDLLDPHHWNSRDALWKVAMNGAFDVPHQKGQQTPSLSDVGTETESDINTITNADTDYSFPSYYDYEVDVGERHPYAVKVPPPPNFLQAQTQTNQPSTDKYSELKESTTGKNPLTDSQSSQYRHEIEQHPSKLKTSEEPNLIVLLTRDSSPKESRKTVSLKPKLTRKDSQSVTKRQEGVVTEPILFSILKK